MENILKVGFGRADITPDYTVHLQGGNYRGRVTNEIYDRIYTTCIAISTGAQTVLLYTNDLKLVTKNFSERTRDVVAQATGVDRENIFLSGTHTHSSVAIRYNWDRADEYREFYHQAAARAAREAMADLAEAQILAGVTDTEMLNNVRHYRMQDGTVAGPNFGDHSSGYVSHVKEPDRQMQVVRFARQEKKDILLVSFGCHGTFHGGALAISADFIGPARDYAEANDHCHFAFFQGACGDQTPGSKLPDRSYKDYTEHGAKVAQYALGAKLEALDAGAIRIEHMLFTAPTNKKRVDRLEDALAVMDLVEQYGANAPEVKAAVKQFGFSSRHEANWIRIRAKAGDETSMDLHVFSIGQLAFVLAPYEMFGAEGRYIKTHSPYPMAFLVGCHDGGYNYIPGKDAFDYNCYESQCCLFARGTAEKLAEVYVEMLKKL